METNLRRTPRSRGRVVHSHYTQNSSTVEGQSTTTDTRRKTGSGPTVKNTGSYLRTKSYGLTTSCHTKETSFTLLLFHPSFNHSPLSLFVCMTVTDNELELFSIYRKIYLGSERGRRYMCRLRGEYEE